MGIFILKFQSTLDSYKYQSSGSGGPSEWSATWETPTDHSHLLLLGLWLCYKAISTTSISWIQFAKKQKFSQCQDTGGKDPDPSIAVMPRDFVISSQVPTEMCVCEPPYKRLTQAQEVTSTHFRWELSNTTFRCFNSPRLGFPVSWHDSSSNHLGSSNKLRSFFHGSGLWTPVNLPLAIYLRDLMMKQKVDLSETWRF